MWRFSFFLTLFLLFTPALAEEARAPEFEDIRSGRKILIRASNPNPAPMTIKVTAKLKGATTPRNPTVVVCPARSNIDAMSIRLGSGRWNYKYHYRWTIGDYRAQHNHRAYRLPYDDRAEFRLVQGYDGEISHHGDERYALDFGMPEGTPVLAARGGTVVRTKADSNRGGTKPSFKKQGNFVTVLHQDGTLADYYHLRQWGVEVRVGQGVQAGQLLGYSGNTGFSTGPHLHFMVYRAHEDGVSQVSLPVKFTVSNSSQPQTLVQGRSYRTTKSQTRR